MKQYDDVDFKIMLKKAANQTDWNDHTGSLLTIAEFFKYKNLVTVFNAIIQLHEMEGSMPEHLEQYRAEKAKQLKRYIFSDYSQCVLDMVNKSL